MSVKIYGVIGSRAIRPLWVAEEAGLAYEHVPIPFLQGAARTPQMLALNPNGHIPVVDDEGIIVWESMACALYLARKYGGSLSAQNHAEEADILKWTFWAVTTCEKDALTVLMHRVGMPEDQRRPQLADEAARRLQASLKILNDHLEGKEWITGNRFTVADITLAAVLVWAKIGKVMGDDVPNLSRWLKACTERPAYLKLRERGKAGA
jgi:glutathione S-transferase